MPVYIIKILSLRVHYHIIIPFFSLVNYGITFLCSFLLLITHTPSGGEYHDISTDYFKYIFFIHFPLSYMQTQRQCFFFISFFSLEQVSSFLKIRKKYEEIRKIPHILYVSPNPKKISGRRSGRVEEGDEIRGRGVLACLLTFHQLIQETRRRMRSL